MTENKLTEAEIMKALECCKAYNYDACSECPFNRNGDCAYCLAVNCLDLINRKNEENEDMQNQLSIFTKLLDKAEEKIEEKDAEIDRLAKEVDRLSQLVLYHEGDIADAIAEAIKEFAKEAKELGKYVYSKASFEIAVDQIAKEMGVEL